MANGTITPEGQPFPMDPLTGINPLGEAASATVARQPAFVQQGEGALELIRKLQTANFAGGAMVPGAQMPTPRMPPPPIQSPQVGIPQGPFGTVGERQRADKQALYGSIGSLVNQVVDRQYKQKVQNIQRDLDMLGGAIQGYKQGQTTGNQEMMQHNAAIINDMLVNDPKKAKELAKVFDVNLNPLATGKKGQQQPNEYTDAGKAYLAQAQQAKKNYPGLSPQAAMFMQRMPQTLQMSPALQAQAEMVKAKLIPSADATTNAVAKIADSIITGQSRLDAATQNKAASMILRSAMMGYGRMQLTGKFALEQRKNFYRMQEILYKHQLALQDPNPAHQATALKELGKNLDDTIGKVKYDSTGKNIEEATGLLGQIARNKEEIDNLNEQLGGWFHWPGSHTLAGDNEIRGKINALQQYNERLNTDIRAFQSMRSAIGAAGAGVMQGGGVNAPTGPAGDQSPDSTGTDEGDEGGGGSDPNADEGLDNLERFFPGLTATPGATPTP